MTTASRFPHLGDAVSVFRERLGPAWQSADVGFGELQRYHCTGRDIAVFFEAGRAVAIHCEYAAPAGWPVRGGPQPSDFDGSVRLRVLVGDGGWVVATPTCPQAFIRLLTLA
jgi:hypothetical protein